MGIKFPNDINLEEMSQLLDRHLSNDSSSPQWLIQYMVGLGLNATKYIGRRNSFDWIWNYYKNKSEDLSMAIWFVLQACRHKTSNRWDNPKDGGLNIEKVRLIAEELVKNPKALASLKRYGGKDLNEFGEYQNLDGSYSIGGSKRAFAYKTTSELISQELDLPKRVKRQPVTGSILFKEKSNSAKSGCLGLIILWGLISGMAIGFVNWII